MNRVAIVGSRRRVDREAVAAFVAALPADAVVITGGAEGPDTWAEEAARARGLDVVLHRPALDGVRNRGEAARRYHDRNKRIASDCDRMAAFVAPARRGGTENAIEHARTLGKPVEVIP